MRPQDEDHYDIADEFSDYLAFTAGDTEENRRFIEAQRASERYVRQVLAEYHDVWSTA